MAWMRMMGLDSVAYHEHTVAGRGDDPVSAAAAYYASRGETPMTWGGSGRHHLDLDGEASLEDYRAIFGPGGVHHPRTGERLVACRRPGVELVVSPSKSVAELGVIGRAEDMHAIADAERDATLAYLDRLMAERGGRRGRSQVPTATGGLIWATARHATTRAGDPQVHDHVLVANAVLMGDCRGGWKAADTAFLRDHVHAATAVGRMAAAAKAVELGYGIVPDPGPSGRLGGWAIAGVPEAVCEVHSKRSAQIEAAVGSDASYASRAVAARATRDRKSHEPAADLMARWQAELADAGHPVEAVTAAVEEAAAGYRFPVVDLEAVAGELLAPGGRLASEKTFTRDQVIVAVAPHLHGLPLPVLDKAVEAVLAHPDAVVLPAVRGAREAVWAAACVLADEERVAALAERLVARPGPAVTPAAALFAVHAVEAELGSRFTDTQRQVAAGLLTRGHRLDLVVGVAGAGKTTTLKAVRAGFEQAGYQVVGTATSGQAAKNLGEGAGIESRTVASLTWRVEQGRVALSDRHVVVLDEAGMTTDTDLGRLLGAVEAAGAKLVVVGDDRQLSAVGPGGGLAALLARHREHVWTLSENLRQRDVTERAALAELRDGSLGAAIAWYQHHDRLHAAPDRPQALAVMVTAWAQDTVAGRDTLLLAYRRENVERLNLAACQIAAHLGRLSGPELVAPGGRAYRAGDRIVTLAPGPKGAWVTSQPAVVTAVDVERQMIEAVTPDGQQLRMGPEEIGADRLAHGYAITAHRAQGATVEIAHVLDDGGGRELAYVAMSRARTASHVYVTAPDPTVAVERLAWAWDQQHRQEWVTEQPAEPVRAAELVAERDRLVASIPPDFSDDLAQVRRQQRVLERDLTDVQTGAGRWAETAVAARYHGLQAARHDHDHAVRQAQVPHLGRLARRRARRVEETARVTVETAGAAWQETVRPLIADLTATHASLAGEARRLEHTIQVRDAFLDAHPGIRERIAELDTTIAQQPSSPRPVPGYRPTVRSPRVDAHLPAPAPSVEPPAIAPPSISM